MSDLDEDRLEARLRRFATQVPISPELRQMSLPTALDNVSRSAGPRRKRPRSTGYLLAVAAAAAVAAIAVPVVLLSSPGAGTASRGSTPDAGSGPVTVGSSGGHPSAPASLSATTAQPSARTPSETPTATTVSSADSALCESPGQFTAGLIRVESQTGGAHIAVDLMYSGSQPCLLAGFGPRIRLVDPDGTVLLAGEQLVSTAPGGLTVRPGEHVTVDALWASWCGKPIIDGGISIWLNLWSSDTDKWIETTGTISKTYVPTCQNGQSVIETYPL